METSDTVSPATLPPAPHQIRARDLLARCKIDWRFKQTAIALGMTLFFICYFIVLNHPVFPVTTMPLIAIDRWIGFQPMALLFYVSLWVYVPLLPTLLVERRELIRYAIAAAVLSIVGLTIFILWPTAVPRPDIDWSLHPSVAFLKTIDASGNACPSLHVAFAVFTAWWLARLLIRLHASLLLRAGNILWATLITYSTLATKQHVSIDALIGTLLGAVVAATFFKPDAETPASPRSQS